MISIEYKYLRVVFYIFCCFSIIFPEDIQYDDVVKFNISLEEAVIITAVFL